MPAVIVAVLLLLAAVAGGYLATIAALHRTLVGVNLRGASRWLRETGWDATTVLIIGIVVAVVGVVLLAIGLLPASRHLIELNGPDANVAAALKKNSLRRTLSSVVVKIDGISRADARIGRRTIRLDANSGLRHTDGLQEAADAAANQRLQLLDLRRPRTVRTQLSRRDT